MQITFATGYTYDSHIWIDLNDDGDFVDAGELVYSGVSGGANPFTLNASFLLNETAAVGMHRMRIGTADNGQAIPNPCYSNGYGVTVDFTVNIVANESCAGTPEPGNTLASASAVCSGDSATLTLQNGTTGSGVTYVWESADDVAFTTNVMTLEGSSTSLEITPIATKYYRAVITCGENSASSTPVMVSLNAPTQCYCADVVFSSAVEPITSVNFAGIDNQSSASVVGGQSLEDFTAISGSVAAGSEYTLTLKGNTNGNFTTFFTVFVDWNQDGDFADEGETYAAGSVKNSTGIDEVTAVTQILVPADALAGSTRIRIKKNFNTASTNPCSGGSYGQSEDYTLIVSADCTPTTWYADADADGYGNAEMSVEACEAPEGYVADATDCDDTDESVWQNGQFFVDVDGDGYTLGEAVTVCYGQTTPEGYAIESLGVDCDDNNAEVFQSQMLFVDADGDGYTVGESSMVCYGETIPDGYAMTSLGEDCDDTDETTFQSIFVFADSDGDGYTVGDAIAICFGTAIPEGYTETSLGEDCNDADANVWQSEMLFADADGDGYTVGDAMMMCYGESMPAGYSMTSLGEDCDDSDEAVFQSDMLFVDADGDGYTVGEAMMMCYGADVPNGYTTTSLGFDCDDTNAAINPAASEIPGNGIDENCNGMADDEMSDIAATTVRADFCGATVGHLDNIFPVGIIGATGYKFNIYDASGTTLVASIENTYSRFRFAQFNFEFNATYQVRVQTKVGNEYSAEGAACSITLIDVPTTTVRQSQCGTTVQPTDNIFPVGITGATGYIFNIYDASGTTLIGSVQNTYSRFRFSQIAYTMGSTYLVKVQVIRNASVGVEGAGCLITVGTSEMVTKVSSNNGGAMEVKIVAYPNPFSDSFGLDITRGTEGMVDILVYDMVGKLLETRSVQASDLSSIALGNRFPAGVYNVIVTQDSNVHTLRVIKR